MPSLSSLERYNRAALRVSVAQVCQTLGWQGSSAVALDVLVDVAQNHLQELARVTARYANQFDRTLANLDDLGLALRDMGVSVSELEEYATAAESAVFPHPVPRLPVPRPTNLSFLKPGSQEIVTRPIHVYEHLPPMHPEAAEDELNDSLPLDSPGGRSATGIGTSGGLKRPADGHSSDAKRGRFAPEEEGRPMREILSVMMTTSGFISPAREGKLPETRLPEPLDDYGDDYRNVKTRKQRADTYRRLSERESERRARDRERWVRSIDEDDLFDIIDVKVDEEDVSAGSSPEKLPTVKETAKLKPFKKHHKSEPVVKADILDPQPAVLPKAKVEDRVRVKKKKLKPVEGKSSKLSIFKKMAKSKQDKAAAERSAAPGKEVTVKKKAKKKLAPKHIGPKLFDVDAKQPNKSADRTATKSAERSQSKPDQTLSKSASRAPPKSIDKPPTGVEKPSKSAEKLPKGAEKPTKNAEKLSKNVEKPAKNTEKSPKNVEKPPKNVDKPSKSSDRTPTKHADRTPPKAAERAQKSAEKPSKPAGKPGDSKPAAKSAKAARPRSPSPPVVSTSSITPPGTPGTPQVCEPRRKPSELSLGELSADTDGSRTPDRPRTPELHVSRHSPPPPPPPPPDPAELLNNPLIPRFPFPFGAAGGDAAVPTPPFPGLPGLRPPPSLFLNPPAPPPPSSSTRSSSPEEPRRDRPRPLASRQLDPRRSPADESDASRSPTPDFANITPLKRLEMVERAEKKKDKEHKKNKKDKKEKKKKDKKDKEKKDLKMEKKEKKKKDEKEKLPAKEVKDETVPKLMLRLSSQDSSNSRSPSPEPATPKLLIKPVREQAEPSTSAPAGRTKKEKAEKKKAAEPPPPPPPPPTPPAPPKPPPPAQLKPPKKEKEKKKSPIGKSKKAVSAVKAAPAAAVIAETVGSFLDHDGNRIWICPECGRQDDGSPMIGCDRCDDWYHWVCVGIQVPPDKNEDWFCPRCIAKMQDSVKQKGRGRGKKK